MGRALWALNHDRPVGELAAALGVTQAQAQAVHDDIRAKRRTTASLHRPPVLVEPVPEPHRHCRMDPQPAYTVHEADPERDRELFVALCRGNLGRIPAWRASTP